MLAGKQMVRVRRSWTRRTGPRTWSWTCAWLKWRWKVKSWFSCLEKPFGFPVLVPFYSRRGREFWKNETLSVLLLKWFHYFTKLNRNRERTIISRIISNPFKLKLSVSFYMEDRNWHNWKNKSRNIHFVSPFLYTWFFLEEFPPPSFCLLLANEST